MSKLNPVLEKMFAIFELIVSFLIINLLIVVLSIVSLFLLYPVLISGIFYILRRIIKFKEYDSLLINYFTFVKKNIVSSLLAGILPMTLSFVIVLTVIFVNPLMIDIINDSYIVVIQIVQLIMLYILSSVLFISLIQVAHLIKKDNTIIIRDSFLILFAKPIRSLLAFMSIFLFGYYLFSFIDLYFIVFAIPILMSLYYIIIYSNIDHYNAD
jgi:hypothetical protein